MLYDCTMPYKDPDKYDSWRRERAKKTYGKIKSLKESTPCTDCGKKFPHYVMEFDHIPEWCVESRKRSIGALLGSRSFESPTLQKELAKCDIVCANCHNTRTYERNQTNVI